MIKYNVYNPMTGENIEVNTKQEAKKLLTKIKKDFLEFNKSLFVINEIQINEDGSTTWSLAKE